MSRRITLKPLAEDRRGESRIVRGGILTHVTLGGLREKTCTWMSKRYALPDPQRHTDVRIICLLLNISIFKLNTSDTGWWHVKPSNPKVLKIPNHPLRLTSLGTEVGLRHSSAFSCEL
ncbi:hypothetical protein GN956_G26229 [Arapaima gigas]